MDVKFLRHAVPPERLAPLTETIRLSSWKFLKMPLCRSSSISNGMEPCCRNPSGHLLCAEPTSFLPPAVISP
jgi:hypothetical protein